MSFVIVGKKTSDLELGAMTLAKAGESLILLSNVSGKIYATSRTCPHAGAALNFGFLQGSEVMCPLHGAMFDVITGDIVMGPASRGLRCFAVKIEGETILVDQDPSSL
jgi:nitrite reductase/ring-hydroxylating ferredoxin subunit